MDWNVEFDEMLAPAWDFVAPGGSLMSTFRLTNKESCKDISVSYQYINFDGIMEGERANYVVLNAKDIVKQLTDLNPKEISAYGYQGAPSETSVTPYDNICFSAFVLVKKYKDNDSRTDINLKLPKNILKPA